MIDTVLGYIAESSDISNEREGQVGRSSDSLKYYKPKLPRVFELPDAYRARARLLGKTFHLESRCLSRRDLTVGVSSSMSTYIFPPR